MKIRKQATFVEKATVKSLPSFGIQVAQQSVLQVYLQQHYFGIRVRKEQGSEPYLLQIRSVVNDHTRNEENWMFS